MEIINDLSRLEEPEMWEGTLEDGDNFCVDFSWFEVRFLFSRFVNGDSKVTIRVWGSPDVTEVDTEEDQYSWLSKTIREALKDHFEVHISALEEKISESSLELAHAIANKDKLNLPVL